MTVMVGNEQTVFTRTFTAEDIYSPEEDAALLEEAAKWLRNPENQDITVDKMDFTFKPQEEGTPISVLKIYYTKLYSSK
jgi:hypothetical protein